MDLVQNAVKATLERLDTFEVRHQGALQAYLRTAVLNQIRDLARQQQRRPQLTELPETVAESRSVPAGAGDRRREPAALRSRRRAAAPGRSGGHHRPHRAPVHLRRAGGRPGQAHAGRGAHGGHPSAQAARRGDAPWRLMTSWRGPSRASRTAPCVNWRVAAAAWRGPTTSAPSCKWLQVLGQVADVHRSAHEEIDEEQSGTTRRPRPPKPPRPTRCGAGIVWSASSAPAASAASTVPGIPSSSATSRSRSSTPHVEDDRTAAAPAARRPGARQGAARQRRPGVRRRGARQPRRALHGARVRRDAGQRPAFARPAEPPRGGRRRRGRAAGRWPPSMRPATCTGT